MSLRPDQATRYARHVFLDEVGAAGQERLLAASVHAPEAGGSAGAALLYLAAAGVGRIVIGDRTRVRPGDLHIYEVSDLDRPRALAIRDRIFALNPDVTVVEGDAAPHVLRAVHSNDPIEALDHGSREAARIIREIVGW